MAAFTSIAAATIAVGGQAAKGFMASSAAKEAAREAGRLEIKQEELEQESVARLEQNFYDAIRATTDIYDKQLQLSNVQGSQILEAAQEGDQRGVAATAGKVKQVQDIGTGQIADKFAMQKLDIDMKRAAASEMDAARISALQDDRAAAAGLEADAKRNEANQLEAAATGAFISAGTSALTAGIGAFGGAEGKAVEGLGGGKEGQKLFDSFKATQGGDLTGKQMRQIGREGTLEGFGTEGYGKTSFGEGLTAVGGALTTALGGIKSAAGSIAGFGQTPTPAGLTPEQIALMTPEQIAAAVASGQITVPKN